MMNAFRVTGLVAGFALAMGCSSQITGGGGASGTGAGTGTGGGTTTTTTTPTGCTGAACSCGSSATLSRMTSSGVDKMDLVLVVDNSASMADKQQILALAIPDLISSIVNPPCVDAQTGQPTATQPASPVDACPAGSKREYPPITDMHIGLLSSSLGTFGADGCPDKPPAVCPTAGTTSNNDHGHLVTRTDACGSGSVPTYQSEGFLAWDPLQKLTPPGESNVGDVASGGLVKAVHDLVIGDGQLGCGFESQNESWYRFLVDPTPYQSISLVNNQVQQTGIDQALLSQRADFLRPDSVLLIVNVTDENDTSIKEYSSYPLFAAPELHLPHARSECTTKGPTDPCCASCGQAAPQGCPADPACAANPTYTTADENTSLRAFGLITHKARYGIEFFYQPSRYVQALTQPTVQDINGHAVPNPIFSNLKPAEYKGAVRDPSLVFYAAIVGVPWLLLARKGAGGMPDLINGVSAIDPTKVGGFKTAAELALPDAENNSGWADVAGDPENYVMAKSPFMVESTVPRAGTDPLTGIAISPTTAANDANAINGRERTIKSPPDDVEFACTFPILHPIDCSASGAVCDCVPGNDNPLCAPNPNDNNNPTLQVRAKAYPGTKHLAIAKGLGSQGIPASICAAQVDDPTRADFGYRPAVKAIVDQIMPRFNSGGCLAKSLPPGGNGEVSCNLIEATNTPSCNCDASQDRFVPNAADACYIDAVKQDPLAQAAHWNCFCEIGQAAGAQLTDCQTSTSPTGSSWCYVDAAMGQAEAALVSSCPAGEQRAVRFVGNAAPQPGATIFLACH